jgi:ribose transport system ATP-binding protein
MTERRVALLLDGVTKTFPGVRALDSVSFDVRHGEIHGLVGENGAGKSTLMGLASGALRPDSGVVTINGTQLTGGPRQAINLGLAIVRQEPSLMPDLSVAENLYLAQPGQTRPPIADMTRWAAALLEDWGKASTIRPSDPVSILNPEQRFVVEIAKALAARPKVLVLDEPTEHLPQEDVEHLFRQVREVAAAGTAVVYISHRIREVRRIADRVSVLRDGRWQGTFDIATVNERQIVELIVGGSLDHEFPPKKTDLDAQPVLLAVEGLSGEGFADVSMRLRRGEITGLAGIDGNGQREFLRAMAGLHPSHGTVRIGDRVSSVRGPESAAALGIRYLSGDRHREGIFAGLSVADNFLLRSAGRMARFGVIDPARDAARTSAAIAAFNVKTPSADTPISSLSGGNQQKLLLASVLEAQPLVLLIDEPTQGVDVGARAEIYRMLRAVADAGTAIIIVSSDAAEIAGLCDGVLVFSRGSIVAELSGAEVNENAITSSVLTSTTTRNQAQSQIGKFWRWAAGNTAPIYLVGLAVLLLGVYASGATQNYLTARNMSGMLALVATLALVSYGQQIIMLIGDIDLSVGPVMGLCVVVGSFFLATGYSGGSVIVGLTLMMVAALAVGLVNFLLVDRLDIHPMIATLATFMAVQAVSLVLRPFPEGLIDYDLGRTIATKLGFVPGAFIVALALGLVLEFVLFRTILGMSFRGLGSRPEAARVVGVPTRRVRLMAYLACSGFAGLAAIPMLAQVGVGDAKAGINYTLASIAAVVIGGASLAGARGTFIGALLGALLINQVNVVSTFLKFDDAWSFYLQGAMVLLGVAIYSKSRQMAQAR